jgi:uncharacterized lipoprotein NlpE involved in copper resistance
MENTNEQTTETTKTITYRGSMKRAMDYINSNATLRLTPETLATQLSVPAMSAYRALRTACANGTMRIEKIRGEVKQRGPSKNVYVKVG